MDCLYTTVHTNIINYLREKEDSYRRASRILEDFEQGNFEYMCSIEFNRTNNLNSKYYLPIIIEGYGSTIEEASNNANKELHANYPDVKVRQEFLYVRSKRNNDDYLVVYVEDFDKSGNMIGTEIQ